MNKISKKILVVDDDEGILDALSLILESAGYSVLASPRGEETLGNIKRYDPDLILLDVLLSGQDGRVICKKLKELDLTKNIPVIMISAHPTAKESVYKCGADDFLPKPFETDELLNKIEFFTNN
jgi:DNA-binding response OmpR family regulator